MKVQEEMFSVEILEEALQTILEEPYLSIALEHVRQTGREEIFAMIGLEEDRRSKGMHHAIALELVR